MPLAGMPCGVHFTGSMPNALFTSPNEVWIELFNSLPGHLKRIPDGELGSRNKYVNWQGTSFLPDITRAFLAPGGHLSERPNPAHIPRSINDIQLLRYDIAAIESYRRFVVQREAGLIPHGVRFQVSLPSPIEAVADQVRHAYQAAAAPFYEQRMLQALANIQESIPPQDLSIQWDVALTIGLIETDHGNMNHPTFTPWFSDVFEHCMATLKRMALATNRDVEMGFHLCYGDTFHQHFCQPLDTSLLVDVAQWLLEELPLTRKINWFQLPVPKNRTDDVYFAPLRDLILPEHTELFLGVVHFNDLQGTKDRIAVAKKFAPKIFGVATECGLGRTPASQFENILKILRDVSTPYPRGTVGV